MNFIYHFSNPKFSCIFHKDNKIQTKSHTKINSKNKCDYQKNDCKADE